MLMVRAAANDWISMTESLGEIVGDSAIGGRCSHMVKLHVGQVTFGWGDKDIAEGHG